MIKTPTSAEIQEIADIWLESNCSAHGFIAAEYWHAQYNAVKEMLSQAQLFAYYQNGEITGFLGLMEQHIAGIFVKTDCQRQGIGKALLAEAKKQQKVLTLSVYAKNKQAQQFYQRQGFEYTGSQIDSATDELEYQMTWQAD